MFFEYSDYDTKLTTLIKLKLCSLELDKTSILILILMAIKLTSALIFKYLGVIFSRNRHFQTKKHNVEQARKARHLLTNSKC